MRYRFFSNSEKTWQAMYEAITDAKESVYMEMYMFETNTENYNFSMLLQKKAKEGLRVRIILDSLGSRNISKESINELKLSGAELYFVSNFLHRTHRKILVVDEALAFIGGVNFSQAAKLWDDLTVEIKGRLVKYIVRSFAKVYVECGGKDPKIIVQNKNIGLGRARDWLVEHFPSQKKLGFKKIYQENITEAKENIILITPYFIPKRWMIAGLHNAVLRGVRVEVLVPQKTDHFLSDRVNYFYMYKLSKLGVMFYVEPEMNHAKAMIIDRNRGMVGSQNVDFFSFDLNYEIGVFFEDQGAVEKLLEISQEWKNESRLFDPETHKPSWFDYILSPGIALFARIF